MASHIIESNRPYSNLDNEGWEQDPYLPNWLPERYEAQKVKPYPDSDHWFPAEEPTAFSQELKRFLKEWSTQYETQRNHKIG